MQVLCIFNLREVMTTDNDSNAQKIR